MSANPTEPELDESLPGIPTTRERLRQLIEALAVVRGKVTLSSGKEADYYIDLRRITLQHEAAPLVAHEMLKNLAEHGLVPRNSGLRGRTFDAVGGLTMGADPIATALLHAARDFGGTLDAFVVRKAAKVHGMQRRIEGPDVAGRRVVVVEDTTTSGDSPIAAIEAVRAERGQVLAVATIVDRDTGAREKIEALGVPYYPLYTASELGL